MTEIAGKNALVTGGASGIGRLMALELVKLGANVIIWDINEPNLERVIGELSSATDRCGRGRTAHGYICDVSDRSVVYDTAAKVKAEVGPLDILINNAGIVSGASFLDLPDEKIEQTFKINALALFWTTKAFLPEMIQRDSGHIVTVASASGLIGVAKLADYASSKFAAVGFDESLRMELGSLAPGIKTTVVCPYYINTGMFDGVKTRFSFLMPILEEQDVAAAVVKAIQKNKERLMMPPLVYLVPILRGLLPARVLDVVANMLGINKSMEHFKGRG